MIFEYIPRSLTVKAPEKMVDFLKTFIRLPLFWVSLTFQYTFHGLLTVKLQVNIHRIKDAIHESPVIQPTKVTSDLPDLHRQIFGSFFLLPKSR